MDLLIDLMKKEAFFSVTYVSTASSKIGPSLNYSILRFNIKLWKYIMHSLDALLAFALFSEHIYAIFTISSTSGTSPRGWLNPAVRILCTTKSAYLRIGEVK